MKVFIFILVAISLSGCNEEKPIIWEDLDGLVVSSMGLGYRYCKAGLSEEEMIADITQYSENRDGKEANY